MVSVIRIHVDDPRFLRLLQLYLHEWSALVPTPIGDDALFVYKDLPLYRDRDMRGAFLFIDAADGRTPLGFALTQRDSDGCSHVEEFFVVAGMRRRGAGREAARRLLSAHPGPWTLTVRPENPGAQRFWRAAVPAADVQEEVGDDGVTRTRLRFEAR